MQVKDLYWAAGFMEGEATFAGGVRQHITPTQRGRIKSSQGAVCQVQREPLERLEQFFGGSINRIPERRLNQRDTWRWVVAGGRARGVMMTVYPLMSPSRQQQIRYVLEAWLQYGTMQARGEVCAKGHRRTWQEKAQYWLCLECKRLKDIERILKQGGYHA